VRWWRDRVLLALDRRDPADDIAVDASQDLTFKRARQPRVEEVRVAGEYSTWGEFEIRLVTPDGILHDELQLRNRHGMVGRATSARRIRHMRRVIVAV